VKPFGSAQRPRTRGVLIALLSVAVPVSTATAKPKVKRGPINAKVAVDSARAATALITAAGGGTVTVTTANGTKIVATFPAGAVSADTQVTAVPVTRLASRALPSGLLAGVQFGPEGLVLSKPATVRFARTRKAPGRTRLTFVGSQGTGRDVYRLPPATRTVGQGKRRRLVATGAPTVSISHFSTVNGFDWGTATIAQIDAINRPAIGIDALSQEISRLLAEHASLAELSAVFDRYRTTFLEPLLANALARSCSEPGIRANLTALSTALAFERQAALLGGGSNDAIVALPQLLLKTATCMTTLCPTLGDPRAGPYFLGLAHQLAILGVGSNPGFLQALFDNLVACGTFTVHVDSTINYNIDDAPFTFHVDGRAIYVPTTESGPPPKPQGALSYVSTGGSAPSACVTTAIAKTTNGIFEVSDVALSTYDPDKPTLDPVKSLTLGFPTVPSETYHTRSTPTVENCGTDMPPDYDAPQWYTGLQVEHPTFTFAGTDFVRDTAPTFALAVYTPNITAFPFGGGSISENTLIELISTPGPVTPLPDPD
jgi:hypothetical protein